MQPLPFGFISFKSIVVHKKIELNSKTLDAVEYLKCSVLD